MSPVFVTARRTLSYFRNNFSSALVSAVFLVACAVRFSLDLDAADGSSLPVVAVWAASVSPFLPLLAAVLSMDVWSEERRTGRVDFLLSIAVRERDLVFGKAFGVFVAVLALLAIDAVIGFGALLALSPSALAGFRHAEFASAFAALALQSALWTSIGVMVSSFFIRGAASAAVSIVLTAALPRAAWLALQHWSSAGRPALGEFICDAQIVDAAMGVFSTAAVAGYVIWSFAAIFIASKSVLALRFRGRGGFVRRFSSLFAAVLAVLTSVSLTMLALRLDTTLELPVQGGPALSQRTRRILSESSGNVAVTCFMPRGSSSFRSVSHLLRSVRARASSLGSVRISISYVDPRWDLGAAERLVRQGVPENSVVFVLGHRMEKLSVSDGFDERAVATAIRRIAMPPRRRDIFWTRGHGEISFRDYGQWGMSDIARELVRDGYENSEIDLSSKSAIPSSCAMIVVAGARQDFSRAELARLDSYLRNGGRLLVLAAPSGAGGVSALLPSWGVRGAVQPLVEAKTISGSDVVVSDFADHPVTGALAGSRVIFEKPLVLASTFAATTGAQGADRLEFTALASVGSAAVAAAVERGAGAGGDLAVRPTRLVVIGDSSFVANAQLASRANANRDLFLNAVSYLAGVEAVASGAGGGRLETGMDREAARRYLALTAAVCPAVVLIVFGLVVLRRRLRK